MQSLQARRAGACVKLRAGGNPALDDVGHPLAGITAFLELNTAS